MSLFLILLLSLCILVSLLLTLNILHIFHDVKNAKIHALYWKKRKKSMFNRLQNEVFFLRSISPDIHMSPQIWTHQIRPLSVYMPRVY